VLKKRLFNSPLSGGDLEGADCCDFDNTKMHIKTTGAVASIKPIIVKFKQFYKKTCIANFK
jgi:hypothetical protein